jgi:hypothetical protein
LRAAAPAATAAPVAPADPIPTKAQRWRGRAAALGIAAALAVLGGTIGVLVLRPDDQSIASSTPPSTVVASSADPLSAWTAYTSPDGSFSVRFPAAPTVRDDKVPDGALPERMFVADPAAVFVSNLPLTLDPSQLDALFASSIDGGIALLRTRATIGGQTPTRVLGLPAQEITLRANGKTSFATFILTRHRVLLLMTDAPDVALHRAFVATLVLPNG